jgi:2'-5' RNA ligase
MERLAQERGKCLTALVAGHRGLAIFPPRRISTQIDKWRRVYDPLFALVPPHITVAYPPFVPEEDWPAVQPELARCLSSFFPFHIRLRWLGTFSGETFVLWLRPEDDGTLVRIHARLAEEFPQHVPALPFDYVPHLTIGCFEAEHELRRAQQAVEDEIVPRQFLVKELMYTSHDQGGTWCVCQRLALGAPQDKLKKR